MLMEDFLENRLYFHSAHVGLKKKNNQMLSLEEIISSSSLTVFIRKVIRSYLSKSKPFCLTMIPSWVTINVFLIHHF